MILMIAFIVSFMLNIALVGYILYQREFALLLNEREGNLRRHFILHHNEEEHPLQAKTGNIESFTY